MTMDVRPTALSDSGPRLSALHMVGRPRALRTLVWMLAIATVVFLIALIIVPWQQAVIGKGRVVAYAPYDRIQTIAAPVDGRIRQAWVIEGSEVETGDKILEIVDNDPSILQRLEAQRVALETQQRSAMERVELYARQIKALEQARELAMTAAENQVRVAEAATRSAKAALEGAKANASQARLNYERQQELVAEGLVSGLDYEVAERVYREAEARLDQAQQTLEGAQSTEAARSAELGRVATEATAGIESARGGAETAEVQAAELSERLAELGTRIAQQSTQLIVAPRAGTVFRLYGAPGAELVKAGDPLVSLIPNTESRAVELWVRGNDVPLIDKGKKVRLQFEGWPAVQFAGWPSVAVGTFGGLVALVDQSDDGQGRFRILVVPDPQDDPWPEGRYLDRACAPTAS